MEERPGDEPGERGWSALSSSLVALLSIIAVAGGIGIAVSLSRHTPTGRASPPASVPTLQSTSGTVARGPRSGALFSVADDLATHEVVLFGGVGNYANTWLWDGIRWRQAHPSTSPPGRFGASAAYDPDTRTVLLFGGRTEPRMPIHDTWGWNGTDWQALDSGAGGPAPGTGSDMAWDDALHEMVLTTQSGVLGEPASTWVWAGTQWRHPAGAHLPAGAFYTPMWFDPKTKSLLAVGCCEGPPPSTGAVNTTWRWNGSTWSLLATPSQSPVDASTMALDPATGSIVLCACGSLPAEPRLLQWDGSAWESIAAGAIPVDHGVEITDAERHQLLLLGSPVADTQSGPQPVQVWTLSGSSWRRVDRPNT
ncbi:MAG TPA: hypothetical protein VIM76_06145 [Candidatus Dormibacteraeota bacterium]|jgi:hypothetical protein